MSVFDTSLRVFRNVIYRLKRQYGIEITIKRVDKKSTSYTTGIRTVTYTEITVVKAVVGPLTLLRQFDTKEKFEQSGYYDTESKVVLIDGKDIDITLNSDDLVIIGTERFSIKEVVGVEQDNITVLVIQSTKSTPTES